jgi:hypothetical protein
MSCFFYLNCSEVGIVAFTVKQGLGHGKAHDAVVGKLTAVCQKLKVFGFDVIPLETGADNIPNNCPIIYNLNSKKC